VKFCAEGRTERMRCEKRTVKFPMGSPNAAFFCVYKEHFSPISSKPLSSRHEIYEKLLIAYTDELKSHLRHTYRDKCGEPAPISILGNMSLCVNYPFLSSNLRNQTRILSNKKNVQLVQACCEQFASNEKRQIHRNVL